jgi:hypothetical protein
MLSAAQHIVPLHACNLARQPCPAALPGSLARQPCPAALPGSLARQPCPAALPSSLAQQPCPAVRPISTGFDARSLAPQSPHCNTVAGHQTECARCCPDRFKLVFCPISLCFHYLHSCCPADRFNLVQLFLCRPIIIAP